MLADWFQLIYLHNTELLMKFHQHMKNFNYENLTQTKYQILLYK